MAQHLLLKMKSQLLLKFVLKRATTEQTAKPKNQIAKQRSHGRSGPLSLLQEKIHRLL